MTKTTFQTAVMFADVAGSSALYKKLGDIQANAAVSNCVSIMVEEVETHHGNVIKTIGDEVMARFDTAADACLAATAIQRRSKEDADLAVRIGIDYGSAILENNDVFGQVVNDAAAVSHIARGDETVITQNVSDNLPTATPYGVKLHDTIKLKGSQRDTNIYRVALEEKEVKATQFVNVNDLDPSLFGETEKPSLQIKHKDKFIKVTEDDTPFVIGRDSEPGCNLVIDSTFASRKHLNLMFRRGKFILVDHSTNGTYVIIKDSAPIYLRREELPLTGSGRISLGKKIEPDDDDVLSFEI